MKEIARNILKYAVIAGLTVVGVKFIMSFKKDLKMNELGESIKLIKTQTVVLDTHIITVPVYGNLVSKDEIEIIPEAGGKLLSNNFREGNTYKAGEVVASMDDRELSNNLKSQKSNLLNQVAMLVTDLKFDFPDAVNDWENFLSAIQFDAPLPDLPKVNDVKLKKYLAGKNIYNSYFAIQAQEEKLAKFRIVAPFDGVLSEALVKPGTVIRVGQKIGKLINPNQFELEANVSLNDGTQINIGDKVYLHSNDVPDVWVGQVSRINKSLSEASQNMDVFISVSATNLYSGMYLFGEINRNIAANSLSVSRSLLSGKSIFTVVDNKLKANPITVLQIKGENAIISGLNNGDVIPTEAIKGAYEGMKVRSN